MGIWTVTSPSTNLRAGTKGLNGTDWRNSIRGIIPRIISGKFYAKIKQK